MYRTGMCSIVYAYLDHVHSVIELQILAISTSR